MKSVIFVALALVAVAVALPVEEPVQIVRSAFDPQPDGSYSYSFEATNGIKREETGEVKEALDEDNKPHAVVVVRGYYTYLREDGQPETVNYFADETGYHAEGDSIPKPARR